MGDNEVIWRVCNVIKGNCKRCPASETIDGDECVRGCYLQAAECVNTVETGNPWRKTEDVRPPWINAPSIVSEDALEATTRQLREQTDPQTARLLSAVREAREALVTIGLGSVPRPVKTPWRNDGKPSKNDKCPHGAWMYEDCGGCNEDFARTTLARLRELGDG